MSLRRKPLTQDDLRRSSNSFIGESAQKGFCEANDNDVAKGLEKLFNDIRPGSIFTFNDRKINVSTQDQLKQELMKEFPEQYPNMLRHYSQMTVQYTSAFLFAIPRDGSLTEAGKRALSNSIVADPRSSYLKVDFFTNKGSDTIFCRTTALQPLNVIPGNELNNHWSRVETVFQLNKAPESIKKQKSTWSFRKPKPVKEGFELLSIHTDNDIVKQLFLGSVDEAFFSKPSSPSSLGQKIAKVASAILAVFGVATAADRVKASDNTEKSKAAKRVTSCPYFVGGDSRTVMWGKMGVSKEKLRESAKSVEPEKTSQPKPVVKKLTSATSSSVRTLAHDPIGIRAMMR